MPEQDEWQDMSLLVAIKGGRHGVAPEQDEWQDMSLWDFGSPNRESGVFLSQSMAGTQVRGIQVRGNM